MGLKTEDIGWDLTMVMVCKNYGAKCYRFKKRIKLRLYKYYPQLLARPKKKIKPAIDLIKEINAFNAKVMEDNKKIEIEEREYQQYLSNQTPEQFVLAKKYGWRIAQMLTAPQQNFHIEQ